MSPDGTTATPKAACRNRASRSEDVEALIEWSDLLPDSDGEPLESPWHFDASALLKDVLSWHWCDRDDFCLRFSPAAQSREKR